MVFTDIRLQNYRSYKDSSFELGSGVTIVVGPNAAGKSNLIEALMLVANGVGYRGKEGLIKHGADWARVDVHTASNQLRTVKITQHKEFSVDSKIYKRLPFAAKQPVVLFEPNHLFLLHGDPQGRREYLDSLAAQLDNEYAGIISRYKRTLSQRNALLKSRSFDGSQLFVWNIRLSELAEKIVKTRTKIIGLINKKLSKTYSVVANKKSALEIKYKNIVPLRNYSAALLKKFEADQDRDLARGFTSSGPHREDIEIFLDGSLAYERASRGETRTLLLALKIIELELLEEKTGNKPLLLLDDVFSELDGTRRKALTRFLQQYQTVITTTDADIVLKNFSQNCQIIPLQGSQG